MKATELRLGNRVKFSEDGRECTIIGIPPQRTGKGIDVLFDDGEEIWIELDQFEPAPLTEERLLRLGFEKNVMEKDAHFFRYFIGKIKEPLYERDLELFTSSKGEICYKNFQHPIHNVHQLQNLYFALTGEELTAK